MFQTFNFSKFEQLTFFNVFVELLQFDQLIILVKKLLCSKWLFWGFSNSFIFFGIRSNSVEQSRFWCRAVFLSRWISSSWSFSLFSSIIVCHFNISFNISFFQQRTSRSLVIRRDPAKHFRLGRFPPDPGRRSPPRPARLQPEGPALGHQRSQDGATVHQEVARTSRQATK